MKPLPGLRRFQVKYFYQATGMDRADKYIVGIFHAKTQSDACTAAAKYVQLREGYTKETTEFFRGCLTAKEIT